MSGTSPLPGTGPASVHPVKQTLKTPVTCPLCGARLSVGVERAVLADADHFPYAHVVLHGAPVHALVVYVDKRGVVRGREATPSVEVKQDGQTFTEILRKWSNPF